MKPRSNGNENFVMVFPEELCEKAATGLKTKTLQPRDVAILYLIHGYVNWRSGRAHVTPKGLARDTGMLENNIRASISRLRKELLISRVTDRWSGESYYLINPHLASVGGPQRREHLRQQFADSLE